MTIKDENASFGTISIINHWVIALLMIFLLAFGLYLAELPRNPDKASLVDLHKSFGVLILILGGWRVLWRIWSGFPAEVCEMPRWQQIASWTVHVALLVGILALPLSGYVKSSSGGHPVSLFGLFSLPALPRDDSLASTFAVVHQVLAYILIVVIGMHVLAALKHHVFDKDMTLRRMTSIP